VTNRDLVGFVNTAQFWLESKPADSKLQYAVRKVMKRVMPLIETYNERREDIAREHALEKDGALVLDGPGRLTYSKISAAARDAAWRALARVGVTVEPFLVPVPPDFPRGLVEAWAGFVFAPVEDVEPEA
jgi:hypothetical protein